MNRMNDDAELLRRYAEEDSQAAFTELVQRRLDLVYNAALRRTNDPHRARDVVQQVFTMLARDARKLARHPVLPAWLHAATRNAALNLVISEQRRQARETEALALDSISASAGANPEWDRLRPLLDQAIDELPEADRAAVVLRFLERQPFAEIGAALRVSEDAARMRIDRALDKLRAALARRGITSTAAALGATVSSQPLISAPAGLAAAVAAQALTHAGAGFVATSLVSLMTTKIITVAIVSALVAFGTGAYVGINHRTAVTPTAESSQQSRRLTSLRRDNQQLLAEIAGLNADIARLNAANAELRVKPAAPPLAALAAKNPNIGVPLYEIQQSILTNLQQIDAARRQFRLETGQSAGSVRDLVGAGRYIKAVRTVGGEDYSALSMAESGPLTVVTPDGVSVTFDPAGTLTTRPEIPPAVLRAQELGHKVQASALKAVDAYRAAHNGGTPPNEQAILAYFATPQEGADYAEFLEARKAASR